MSGIRCAGKAGKRTGITHMNGLENATSYEEALAILRELVDLIDDDRRF